MPHHQISFIWTRRVAAPYTCAGHTAGLWRGTDLPRGTREATKLQGVQSMDVRLSLITAA